MCVGGWVGEGCGGGVRLSAGPLFGVAGAAPHLCECALQVLKLLEEHRKRITQQLSEAVRRSSPSMRSAVCSSSAAATSLPLHPTYSGTATWLSWPLKRRPRAQPSANCADWNAVNRAAAGSDRPRLLGCCLRAGAVRCVAAACFHDALRPAGATSADAMCSAVWLRWLAQLSSPAIIDAKRVPCRHS